MSQEAWNTFLGHWKTWWLDHHPDNVGMYSWSYLFEGGKMIRPRLFCALWTHLFTDSTGSTDSEPCIEMAFIIECIHVVSLILDDLPWMDNAIERRGRRTLHLQFSTRKALLLAYDVIELAWTVSQSSPWIRKQKWDVWKSLVMTKLRRLWMGQWLDLSRTGSLYDLAVLKTGTLFEMVTEGVALMIGLDSEYWKEWGRALGVLFQWVDDAEDQEEDARMGQRNAFVENRDETMTRYLQLWHNVVQGIGPSWWLTPFGVYLWRYFTRILPTNTQIPPLSSCIGLANQWSPPNDEIIPPECSFPTLTTSLQFMALFQPFLYRELPVHMEDIVDTDEFPCRREWWTRDESEWMSDLETLPTAQPFLPWIRWVEKKIREVDNVPPVWSSSGNSDQGI